MEISDIVEQDAAQAYQKPLFNGTMTRAFQEGSVHSSIQKAPLAFYFQYTSTRWLVLFGACIVLIPPTEQFARKLTTYTFASVVTNIA